MTAAGETHSAGNTTNTSIALNLSGFDDGVCFYLRSYANSQFETDDMQLPIEESGSSSSSEIEENCEVLPSLRSQIACLSKSQLCANIYCMI